MLEPKAANSTMTENPPFLALLALHAIVIEFLTASDTDE